MPTVSGFQVPLTRIWPMRVSSPWSPYADWTCSCSACSMSPTIVANWVDRSEYVVENVSMAETWDDGSAAKMNDAVDRPAPSSGCTRPATEPAMPVIRLHSEAPPNCVGFAFWAAAWRLSC